MEVTEKTVEEMVQASVLKRGLTLQQMLGLLGVIVIPLLIWGISVETRLTRDAIMISQLKETAVKIEEDLDKIDEKVDKILIALEHKEDIRTPNR